MSVADPDVAVATRLSAPAAGLIVVVYRPSPRESSGIAGKQVDEEKDQETDEQQRRQEAEQALDQISRHSAVRKMGSEPYLVLAVKMGSEPHFVSARPTAECFKNEIRL